MDVNQCLPGMIGGQGGIAIGRGFPEPWADGEDQVGVADTLLEHGVGTVTEIAGIDSAAVVDGVLTPERRRDRNSVTEGEIGEMMRRAGTPVGAPDDGHRRRGLL